MRNRPKRRTRLHEVLILLLTASLASAGAVAQVAIVPLQFSFSDPGARSLGFGGAFVALADDATAAFANPAGLVQLIRPEVSVEGRRWGYSTPYTVGGRIEGEPSGIGLDSYDGLRTANAGRNNNGLSFLSLAFPAGDWSFAVYRHELADFDFLGETQGLFEGGTDCCQIRREDLRVSSRLDFVGYGLATGYRISDRLSLGLGLVYFDASIDADGVEYLPDDDSIEGLFGPNSYLPENLIARRESSTNDTDWALTAGFLWQPSPSWSVGGVYRQAPQVETETLLIAGEALGPDVPPGKVLFRGKSNIELPDNYGLGLAYRAPDGRLTVSFQWTHVEYTNILDSLGEDGGEVTVDDADEWHFGGEYVFLDATPVIAARLGMWWEPDHQIRAGGDATAFERALLQRGDDEMHYAAGLGMAMRNFQIDIGVDLADRVDTVSLSAIYSF
jgi:opacity protein-like surface antigen